MDQTLFPEDELVRQGGPTGPPRPRIDFSRYQKDDVLTREEVAALLGCTIRTLSRMVRRSEIPPPAYIYRRATWSAGALHAHLLDRIQQAAN